MPIQWPPPPRGIQFSTDNDVTDFAPAWDVTNLGIIGVEFGTDNADLDMNSLDPGIGIDNDYSTRVVNLRNLGSQFEPADMYTMAPPAHMKIINYGRQSFMQTDWYQSNSAVIGVTRDSTGAVLANCEVTIYTTADIVMGQIFSDGSGNFQFQNIGTGPFYIVAYKSGGTDVAGTTKNTILPTLV